ncbi:MAG TPA: GNAT family N-acetyltransferase [Pirellulales bacterium]|jgi:GNAT superfamily N-acetyltransferase
MAQPHWLIAPLAKEHDRASFDCGRPLLNDWLKFRAGQFQKRDLARTYVAVEEGSSAVMGYYAISNHRVSYEDLPSATSKSLPRLDVPVVLLGRLAVDRRAQGQGLGALLLIDALRKSQHLADQVGVLAVEVDAIDDIAAAFYRKYGFMALQDDPRHLFLPMHVIRKLDLPPLT